MKEMSCKASKMPKGMEHKEKAKKTEMAKKRKEAEKKKK